MGPRTRLGVLGKRTSACPCRPTFEPRIIQAMAQSQYRLGYPRSCSTAAPTNNTMILFQVRTHATNEKTKGQPHFAGPSLAAPTVSTRLINSPHFTKRSSFLVSRRRIKQNTKIITCKLRSITLQLSCTF